MQGTYIRYVKPLLYHDQDAAIVRLMHPITGFRTSVYKNPLGTKKLHFNIQILGDFNLISQLHISKPPLRLSLQDVKKEVNIKTIAVEFTLAQGLLNLVDTGYSIGVVIHDGEADTWRDTYSVISALKYGSLDEIVPLLSKQDIVSLEEEEWSNEEVIFCEK